MHEYSVMSQLVSVLVKEIDVKYHDRIKTVHIEIGELTFLEPDALEFAFSIITKGTILQGAELEVKTLESIVKCGGCGYQGILTYSEEYPDHIRIPVISCPRCGSKPELIQGRETMIKNITVMEEYDE